MRIHGSRSVAARATTSRQRQATHFRCFMPYVRAIQIPVRQRIVRMVIAAVLGSIIGAGTAYLRPYFDGTVHYESFVSLFIAIPAVMVWLVYSQRRVRWRAAAPCLAAELASVMVSFCVSWSLVYGGFWDDMIDVSTAYLLISMALGEVVLLMWQRFYPLTSGPHCPGCNYCLIGAPSDVCPECGRAFTFHELGVIQTDL